MREERFRGLLEAIPAVVYEAEPRADGAWHYVSGQIRALLGYEPEEFTANPLLWASRIHPDDRGAVLRAEAEQLEAARAGDATVVSEYRLVHRDGRVVWVRDAARVRGDERPVWQGVLLDIGAERALVETYDRYRDLRAESRSPARPASATDVHRITCPRCGAVWAAELVEPCRRCGNVEVEAVSLDETLGELKRVSRQLEGLLDGIHGHLETLRSSLGVRTEAAPGPAADEADRISPPGGAGRASSR